MPMLGLDWLRVIDMTTVDNGNLGFFCSFHDCCIEVKREQNKRTKLKCNKTHGTLEIGEIIPTPYSYSIYSILEEKKA